MPEQKIVITATFTTEPIEESLTFWLQTLDLPYTVEFAPYNQVFQQLLDPASLLSQNQSGLNVLLVRFEDWLCGHKGLRLNVDPSEKEHLLAGHVRYKLPDHTEIAHLNQYETDYVYQEIFVDQAYLKHGITLNDGDCVVDVGANIGLFTLFVQQKCPHATVYAFEPSPPVYEILQTNARLYGAQVKTFNYGLSNETKKAQFTFYRHSSVFSSYYADAAQDEHAVKAVIRNMLRQQNGALDPAALDKFTAELLAGRLESETFVCQLKTLSSIITEQGIDQIDLLKIDVEKSELDILQGIEAEHWSIIKQIVMEVHDQAGSLVTQITRLLQCRGFEVVVDEEVLLQNSGLYNLYATRRKGKDEGERLIPIRAQEDEVSLSPHPSTAYERDLVLALKAAVARSAAPYLLCLCPPSPATMADPTLMDQFKRMVDRTAAELAEVGSVYVIEPAELSATYPVSPEAMYDAYGDKLGHVPFTPTFFTALGTMLARKIYTFQNPSLKVIVLDCDQTLWGGVCAEDGPLGVNVDDPWQALQSFMMAQAVAGRLICLCSKNQAVDVWAVFAQRPEMPLRPEHIVASRINWLPKSENLKSLAQELQLGLDSFVFIDDNPLECVEVQANCPEVLALPLPAEPDRILQFLTHLWVFDKLQITEVDRQRTVLYRQNQQREQLRTESLTLADFLTKLELKVQISPMTFSQLPRVAQLTQRVNQFNATTMRRSESEIQQGWQNGAFESLVVEVSDRFGDYGLVGVIFFTTDSDILKVDTFLLSCRALGRGVEHQMLARLGRTAVERGLSRVDLPYHSTPRNQPILDFLTETGQNCQEPFMSFREAQRRGISVDDGFCFQFPVEVAAALTFKPKTTKPVSVTPPKAHQGETSPNNQPAKISAGRAGASLKSRTWQSTLLTRIATELYTVEQIHTAVETHQRHSRSESDSTFVPARTPTEELLVTLWADILKLDRVDIRDNFFELGGDSLLATQLASRIQQSFGVALSLQHLFEAPILADQAGLLAAWHTPGDTLSEMSITRMGTGIRSQTRPDSIPLSFAQQRLWFLNQLQPDNPAYNIPLAIRLTGSLDITALSNSLAEIVRRHESLRTTFPTIEGQAGQRIAPPASDQFTVEDLLLVDLRALPENEREIEVRKLINTEAKRHFDLVHGPLFYATLLFLNDGQNGEYILLLNMHHIISDRWSIRLFFQELSALYQGFTTGQPVSLPDLPIQYADFALWQRRQWLAGGQENGPFPLQHQLDYWRQQLEDLPTLSLPTDRPRPPSQTFRGTTCTFTLPPSLAESLRSLSQQEGGTLFMTLLAAFQVLLYRYTGQTDIPVGSPIANRHRSEIENLIGFFVNTLVLRTDLSGNPTFRTLLGQVRQVALDAYAHQDLPFDQLVEVLQPERDPSRQPLFQVMFNLQNEPPLQRLTLPGLTATWLAVDSDAAQFDLSLDLIEESQGLSGAFEYNTDLFDPPTIARLAGHFQTLLAGIVANPDQCLSDLPLLTEAEQHQMLVEWNGLARQSPYAQGKLATYPTTSHRCLHHLFEAQVERTPDAVAVIIFPEASQNHSTPRSKGTQAQSATHRASVRNPQPIEQVPAIQLTYRELNQRANQLAHYLQKLGVGPDVRVGLCLERSLEMVVGLLGILKAGGAYVPLDPDYPQERLAFMLAHTQAPVLLTQQKIYDLRHLPCGLTIDDTCPVGFLPDEGKVPEIQNLKSEIRNPKSKIQNPTLVCLDTDWAVIAQEPTENPTSEVTPDNLAYVMYTSGSTGTPKGVMIEHHSLVWYAKTAADQYSLTANDRVLQFASISFDISVEEIYPCLTCGATLVLRTEEMSGAVPDFLEACQQWGITTLFLPTAFWHELATGLANEPWRLPTSLRLVSFGGEKVLPERVAAWRQAIGNRVQLMNGYGPTETTVVATLCQLTETAGATTTWQASSIGRVIPGAQVYILDQNLQPVPIGIPGELYIGGEGVARGYLNQPDLTAETFIPNPFGRMKDILYKTGDMVRYRADGSIEYLGRVDQQIKLRGFRVELAEIEATIAQHPLVREAAVIAQPDKPGHKRLVAYIVSAQPPPSLTQPSPPTAYSLLPTPDFKRELYQFLKGKLPSYMLPTTFVPLAALPLTPNGKVDRRVLPPVDLPESEPAEDFVPPHNRVEEILAELWRQILGLERVGVYDNFFELGGDSILSIQIIARANQAGLRLTPRQIFEHQTIAGLAEVIDTVPVAEAEQGVVTGPVPLTPIQCWFFEQGEALSWEELSALHHWNMSLMFEIEPAPDPTLLEQAIHHLSQHHDALRLRFWPNGPESSWQQFNAGLDQDAHPVSLSETDLSALPPTEQEAAIQTRATALQAGLNLSTGPLLRAALFNLGLQKPARLLIVVHHLAVDGVSWRIFVEDLQTVYRQLSRGEPVRLPPKTTSFKRWAEQLTKYAQSEPLRAEATYWLRKPPPHLACLPVDYPEQIESTTHQSTLAQNTEASARVVSVSLDVEATRTLLYKVPATYHTQINEILLTALAQTLVRWVARETDSQGNASTTLLIDLEGHGREEIGPGLDLSRTIGWFTTLFPVSLTLNRNTSPEPAIQSVKETLRRIPQRGIGYGLLRYLSRDADIVAKLQALPQAEVSFNYLGQFEPGQISDSFHPLPMSTVRSLAGPVRSPLNRRSHLLEVDSYVTGGRLHIDWTYSEGVHRRTTIEGLAAGLIESLQLLITHCQSGYTPADFPLARLDQQMLDQFVADNRPVEDIYPLSPMQQAMLLHVHGAPSSRAYFVQWYCTLPGPLDVSAFRRAWQHVVNRQPILRTAFVWQGLDEPLQVVYRQADLLWEQQDWRGLSSAEQQTKLTAWLAADRTRGFDLTEAPLMRLALIQLEAETYQFIWSHHHLLLDGWSTAPLWQEIFTVYEAFCRDKPPPQLAPPPPYRAYIAWLQARTTDHEQRTTDYGLRTTNNEQSKDAYQEQQIRLSTTTTAQLQAFAQQHRLTLNSVVQGAWALLLRHYSGQERVTFWVVASDRPAVVEFESMVGLLLKMLLVRVEIPLATPLVPWLTQFQQQQVELRQQTEHILPAQTQRRGESGSGAKQPLFESVLRFQNYPLNPLLSKENTARKPGSNLEIRHVGWVDRWPYPLNVEVVPGSELLLQMSYNQHHFKAETVQQMLNRFQALLEAFVAKPQQPLAALLVTSSPQLPTSSGFRR